jgi:hypothetical protein
MLTGADLWSARSDARRDLVRQSDLWRVSADAVAGVWAAFDYALAEGVLI